MDITFSGADLVRFGIIMYVGLWLCLVIYLHLYARRRSNVHKIAFIRFITIAWRHWGWIVGMIIGAILSWVLPDISVVSQNPERKRIELAERYEKWHYGDMTFTEKESFYVDKYYVPFAYNGRKCNAFGSYLLNSTDSTLAFYITGLFNGQFSKVSNADDIEIIPPGYFRNFEGYIHNEFDMPRESNLTYIPKDRKDKATTELTITFVNDALYETEKIRETILRRNRMIIGVEEKDSLGIPFKARELVLKQLKEMQDAKQGEDRK